MYGMNVHKKSILWELRIISKISSDEISASESTTASNEPQKHQNGSMGATCAR